MTDFHSFMPGTLRGLLKKLIGEFRDASHESTLGRCRVAAIDANLNALCHLLRNGCAWPLCPRSLGPGAPFAGISTASQRRAFSNSFKTTYKVYQHANGCGGMKDKAIGKSRGSLNTKIHIVVDALRKLVAPMELTAENVSDVTVAPRLLKNLEDTTMVEDKGYDSWLLWDKIRARDCEPCIPVSKNVKAPEPYDAALYCTKHTVENVFQHLKVFRRMASRFEKTKRMFFTFIYTVMAAIFTPLTISGD